MGNLYPLTFRGKSHRVVSDDIASPHGGKANGFAVTRAGMSFTSIDGDLSQVAAQCIGHHLAHTQGGTGGCIDFVTVSPYRKTVAFMFLAVLPIV